MKPFVFLLVISAHHPTSVVRHIPRRLQAKCSDCRFIKLQHLWRNTFHGPWRPHELHSLSLLFPASIHLALQCGGFWPWWMRDEDMCKIKRFILVYLSGLFGLQGRSRQHSRTRDESRGKFAGESPEETEQSGATVRWRAGSCSAADECVMKLRCSGKPRPRAPALWRSRWGEQTKLTHLLVFSHFSESEYL